jgi:hypothetical protein
LPVVRNEQLAGIITESDLFRAFANIFDPGSHGVRITFDNAKGEDVFPLIAQVTHHHRLRVTSFVSLLKHERPVCVVQVIGENTEAMLNDIWKSHHQVISVIQLHGPQTDKSCIIEARRHNIQTLDVHSDKLKMNGLDWPCLQ